MRHFNVWLDVKPSAGHRVLMQSYPGGIQSGMDYYLNDAGLLVAETTLAQTKFDADGQALASRIRKAVQYSATIDEAVTVLKTSNNGMYTNEWLLADTKTNEIAMFELGTHKNRLWRSSKKEWFGGTKGFYWGCNNAKDLDVRLETVASLGGKPANMVFHPSDRDRTWLRLYREHAGKINESFGFLAFTTPPLSAFPSCDAKFTTSALAKELKTWALFGPPLGKTWEPTQAERERYPGVVPLVPNDWTLLTAECALRTRVEEGSRSTWPRHPAPEVERARGLRTTCPPPGGGRSSPKRMRTSGSRPPSPITRRSSRRSGRSAVTPEGRALSPGREGRARPGDFVRAALSVPDRCGPGERRLRTHRDPVGVDPGRVVRHRRRQRGPPSCRPAGPAWRRGLLEAAGRLRPQARRQGGLDSGIPRRCRCSVV